MYKKAHFDTFDLLTALCSCSRDLWDLSTYYCAMRYDGDSASSHRLGPYQSEFVVSLVVFLAPVYKLHPSFFVSNGGSGELDADVIWRFKRGKPASEVFPAVAPYQPVYQGARCNEDDDN